MVLNNEYKKRKIKVYGGQIIAFSIVFSIIAFLIFFSINDSKSDLRAELYYYTNTFGFFSKQNEGMIHIRGWIYNYGSKDINVTVNLRVSDGTKSGGGIGSSQSEYWQSYYVPIGIVPGEGGCKWFEWDQRYNPFDPTTAQFTYELIPAPLVRKAP